ncbi:MAG: hypothetical protein LUQ31_02175 [Methanoregula sp.]|nr:hypothetical protein [Methanoregula sp.]
MFEATREHIKKFEDDHEVYMSADDKESYWIITARIPKKTSEVHHTHRMVRYVSARSEGGTVLVLHHPEVSESYTVEDWGTMDTIDDFVEKSFKRILEDKEEYDRGSADECGTGCP